MTDSPPLDTADDRAWEEPRALLRAVWATPGPGSEAAAGPAADILFGADAPLAGAAALAPQQAVSLAVLTAADAAAFADELFGRWFPRPASVIELRRLAALARRGEPRMGLIETADGVVVVAWAGAGAAAERWPLAPQARQALEAPGRVLVVIFAPTRSSELAASAADAFGLSPLEARLAEAFLSSPTLDIAAAQVGVGRETARDAMDRIMTKTGVRRSTDIVRRLTELMCAAPAEPPAASDALIETLGLTPAEAGVAVRIAAGRSHREAADDLGLKLETVRGYAKAALAKVGVARAKDLARLVTEIQALSRLIAVAEPIFTSDASPARLRLIPAEAGRRLAFLDYGPQSGAPICVFHGFMAGRSLPPAQVRALQRRGLRPLVLQRPGFGLTTPASGEAYLDQAIEDLAMLLKTLRIDRTLILARDGGVAVALGFAARHPERVAGGLLLNPRQPRGLPKSYRSPVATFTRGLLNKPQVIGALGDLLRRQTRTEAVEAILRRGLTAVAGDRAALEDDAVRSQLVRDIQAQFAHSSAGFVAEHALYARGWSPPAVPVETGAWVIAHCAGLGEEPPRATWSNLPRVGFHVIPEAGVLVQFTHAEALAACLPLGD